MNFVDLFDVVAGFVPLSLTTQRDAQFTQVLPGQRLVVILFKGAGQDGEDPIFTLQQATNNVGAGIKALLFTKIWRKQGADVQAVASFTETTQSAATSYTNTDGHQQCIWLLDVDGDSLDTAGGFSWVRVTLNDVGTEPQLGCVLYLLQRNDALDLIQGISDAIDSGVAMTPARTSVALLGTDEFTGVSIASAASSQGSQVDVLGSASAVGHAHVYLFWTAASSADGRIDVVLQRIRADGGEKVDDLTLSVPASLSGGAKYLGYFPVGRYMSVKVANRSNVAASNVSVLLDVEKLS